MKRSKTARLPSEVYDTYENYRRKKQCMTGQRVSFYDAALELYIAGLVSQRRKKRVTVA